MPKKRKGGGGAAIASAPEATAAAEGASSAADLDLALRALRLLAADRRPEGGAPEALLEAVRPLIAARAARYEEDAKAAKVANAGNPGGAKGRPVANAGKKRPNESFGDSADVEPLGAGEAEEAARALEALSARAEDALQESKALRTALHPLVEAHLREQRSSPAFQITCALERRSRWPEALRLLESMRSLPPGRRPKLGAYQRWVRALGVAEGDATELLLLDAIMRVAIGLPASGRPTPSKGTLLQLPEFSAPGSPVSLEAPTAPSAPSDSDRGAGSPTDAFEGETLPSRANQLLGLIASRRAEAKKATDDAAATFDARSFSVLAHEAALDRMPPNRFDLDIFTCAPGALSLATTPERVAKRFAVPGVEGAFVLSDVLSPGECSAVRAASEVMGYRPDVPLSSPLDERAENVVIVATEQQNDALYSRVQALLPQELDGHCLAGLNRRWRLYRYKAGNLYRKHLDGAWPASGVREGPGGRQEYVYDATSGGTRSRLTFIIYLSDDFEGGRTTFFVPREGAEGTLEARPVQPRLGYATVFPHGDCPQPLLHEGSSVSSGCKYLLRTEVLYSSPDGPDAAREAARIRGLARKVGGDVARSAQAAAAAAAEAARAGSGDAVAASGARAAASAAAAVAAAAADSGGVEDGGVKGKKAKKKQRVMKRTLKGKGGKKKEAGAPEGDAGPSAERLGKKHRKRGAANGAVESSGEKMVRSKKGARRANTARKNLHWHA